MEGYCRPLLCRLCECPVVDGGVQLQEYHLDKLSRWWKAHWDTEFEDVTCVVCHFCVWDLRFANQHSEENEPFDQTWWLQDDRKGYHNYYNYYSDERMKSCSVKITPLPKEHGKERLRYCLYCSQSCATHRSLVKRVKTTHPDVIIYCNKKGCGMFFHTKEEKILHIEEEHQTENSVKCFYCGKVSSSYVGNYYHLKTKHKHQLIRCKHGRCSQMFNTAEDRDNHFEAFHNSGNYCCCFCDRYFESRSVHWFHMKRHKEALKCNATRGCSDYFKTEEDRQEHVKEKHSKKFKCIYCDESFSEGYIRTTHVKLNHKDVALCCEYSGHFCTTWFKTEEERQKHYLAKHGSVDDLVPCPFCNKKFHKLSGIQRHFKIHHPEEKILKCKYSLACANYFANEKDRLKHVSEFHKKIVHCPYCDMFFPKHRNMHFHVKNHHKDVVIRCNFSAICGTYFKNVEDREKHVREVHQAEKIRKLASCLYCGNFFSWNTTLLKHVKLKHSKIAIKCPSQCSSYFKSQDELETHFSLFPTHKNKVTRIKPKNFKCAHCLKRYMNKSALTEHIEYTHITNGAMCPHCKKPTAVKRGHIQSDFCKVCNKKFQCLGLLRSHRKKCRPVFRCPVCSKSFKMKCELNYHCKMKHTVPIVKWKGLQYKSKGLKCEECFSYFNSKLGIKLHRKSCIHITSKVTCDTCKMQFPNKLYLRNHIWRIHLGLSELFRCSICNLKLQSKSKLRKHVQNKCNKNNFAQCVKCEKIVKSTSMKSHNQRMH